MEDTEYWDNYYMLLTEVVASRSQDPDTKTGACLVGKNNELLSTGYNSLPKNWNESVSPFSWKDKNFYICPAGVNVIFNLMSKARFEEARMYLNYYPCSECAKCIVQAGIKEVIYNEIEHPKTGYVKQVEKIFNACGVKLRQFTPTKP